MRVPVMSVDVHRMDSTSSSGLPHSAAAALSSGAQWAVCISTHAPDS
jgi:hypothetical protein